MGEGGVRPARPLDPSMHTVYILCDTIVVIGFTDESIFQNGGIEFCVVLGVILNIFTARYCSMFRK